MFGMEKYNMSEELSFYEKRKSIYHKICSEIPIGWIKSIANHMADEITNKIEELGIWDDYCILQVKEKFGYLRYYAAPRVPEIEEIVNKYIEKSKYICTQCGALATRVITNGWHEPLCISCTKAYAGKKNKTVDEISAPAAEYWDEWTSLVNCDFDFS